MNVEKHAIRQRLREQRRALPARTVEAAGRAVAELLRGFAPYDVAVSVIAYIADENEVPTRWLLDDAARSGRKLYLPRSTGPVGVVRWRPGDPLTVGRGGVSEPRGGPTMRPELPVVAFLPTVGWNTCGDRIGRGGGFYDRLFAASPTGVTRVGLAYEFQECPEVLRDPWDVTLDYVITERRIVECRGAVAGVSLQKGELQLS